MHSIHYIAAPVSENHRPQVRPIHVREFGHSDTVNPPISPLGAYYVFANLPGGLLDGGGGGLKEAEAKKWVSYIKKMYIFLLVEDLMKATKGECKKEERKISKRKIRSMKMFYHVLLLVLLLSL